MKQPIQIGFCNISERSKIAIAMVLKEAGVNAQYVTDESKAQLAIIDIDSMAVDKVWHQCRYRFPTQPAVVLSLTQPQLGDVLWVKKPVQPAMLVEAITEGVKKMQFRVTQKLNEVAGVAGLDEMKSALESSVKNAVNQYGDQHLALEQASNVAGMLAKSDEVDSFCGKLPDIETADLSNTERWFYDPKLYLQGTLADTIALAHQDYKARVIECGGYVILVFPGNPGVLMTTMNTRRLRNVSLSPLGILVHANVRDLISRKRPITHQKLSQENFCWFLALSTSNGRLPVGTDLHAPIALKYWPNFTRLEVTPHAMQIAALWVNKPMGLLATAAYLQIPQRYVFGFYSAAHAIGIAHVLAAGKASAQPQASAEPKAESDTRRGLFARMLAKLRSKN